MHQVLNRELIWTNKQWQKHSSNPHSQHFTGINLFSFCNHAWLWSNSSMFSSFRSQEICRLHHNIVSTWTAVSSVDPPSNSTANLKSELITGECLRWSQFAFSLLPSIVKALLMCKTIPVGDKSYFHPPLYSPPSRCPTFVHAYNPFLKTNQQQQHPTDKSNCHHF